MVRCADDTVYTGITTDLERRLAEHNGEGRAGGAGAKYTRSRRPVTLIYSKKFKDRSGASAAEAAVKKLSREEKLAYIGLS
ncbi:MAG TPA: GIY-YIG nuclease family protein [Candidatus Paceibacterota bacterium]|nr:GIY-YIG nuclease family protein [Candidatus Paceibacterota bacterium]